jgi:hypothetical protein
MAGIFIADNRLKMAALLRKMLRRNSDSNRAVLFPSKGDKEIQFAFLCVAMVIVAMMTCYVTFEVSGSIDLGKLELEGPRAVIMGLDSYRGGIEAMNSPSYHGLYVGSMTNNRKNCLVELTGSQIEREAARWKHRASEYLLRFEDTRISSVLHGHLGDK